MPMTTDATTTTTTTTTPAPAAQMTAADDKALKRIGYVLAGAATFCGGMAVYTSLTPQTIRSEFMSASQRPAHATAPSSFTTRISASQFLR